MVLIPGHATLGAACVVAALIASGCTQAKVASDSPVVIASQSTASATSSATTSMPANEATSSQAPPTTSSPTLRVSASSSAATPSPSITTDPNACTKGSLTITVERGSGVNGFQYATLRFTNSSTKACNLTGFPSVQLMLGGRPLGNPATHTSAKPTTVSIAPGHSATAQLRNESTCNADNSDSVQVVAPGAGTTTVQPLRRRACGALVDPVIAG